MKSTLITLAATLVISVEMISQAKEKYGDGMVKIASLPLDDDETEFLDVLIRVPDLKLIGQFEKWVDKEPYKAKEILLNGCLLTFKDTVKSDDALFTTCFNAIAEIIPVRKARIKNC